MLLLTVRAVVRTALLIGLVAYEASVGAVRLSVTLTSILANGTEHSIASSEVSRMAIAASGRRNSSIVFDVVSPANGPRASDPVPQGCVAAVDVTHLENTRASVQYLLQEYDVVILYHDSEQPATGTPASPSAFIDMFRYTVDSAPQPPQTPDRGVSSNTTQQPFDRPGLDPADSMSRQLFEIAYLPPKAYTVVDAIIVERTLGRTLSTLLASPGIRKLRLTYSGADVEGMLPNGTTESIDRSQQQRWIGGSEDYLILMRPIFCVFFGLLFALAAHHHYQEHRDYNAAHDEMRRMGRRPRHALLGKKPPTVEKPADMFKAFVVTLEMITEMKRRSRIVLPTANEETGLDEKIHQRERESSRLDEIAIETSNMEGIEDKRNVKEGEDGDKDEDEEEVEEEEFVCTICLEDFQVGDVARSLPCRHIFHGDCIDPWLKNHSVRCPCCNTDVRK